MCVGACNYPSIVSSNLKESNELLSVWMDFTDL